MASLASPSVASAPPVGLAMSEVIVTNDPDTAPGALAAQPPTPEQAAADADAEAREAADQEAAAREAQLQVLMQRIHQHADFPSLKDSIRGIQSVARSESAHMRALTEEVLGDVALSNKLLRMINTAFYSSVGAGSISSLQRAVALMGFQPVGMLATSLTLFDKLPKGPNGARVREEFSRALMAAMLANQFCPVRKLEESAYIAAMFQNLGTMLAWMHFPPEAAEVEAAMARDEASDHAALQKASRQVLGMGYDDLATEVTRQWGWPESLQISLRRLEPSDPESAATPEEYLRVVCTAANHMAVQLDKVEGPEALEACLAEFKRRYAVPLSLSDEELPAMVERARAQWAELSLVLGFAKLQPPGAKTGAAQRASLKPRLPPAAALTKALDAVSQRVTSKAPLTEVLQLVMDQMHDALDLQRVVICLRDGASGELVGRLGVGDRAMTLAPHFRVPMDPPSDLFGLLCAKEADTLISDTTDRVIAQRLPTWFRQYLKSPCFLLLPLVLDGKAVGLIYGDRAEAHSLTINDAELNLLKALRNQLIVSMRLRGVSG